MTTETVESNQARRSVATLVRRLFVSEYFVLYLTIAYFLLVWAFVPWLGNRRNLSNILSNMWPLLTVAIGETFVLVVAGIDLSQAAIMSVSSVASASLLTTAVNPVLFSKSPLWGVILSEQGGVLSGAAWGLVVAIGVMILIGILIGLINGVSVALFRMPPFIVTLVSFMLFGALAIFLTKSENIMNLPTEYVGISEEYLGVFSVSMAVAVGVAVTAHIILSKTKLGRWMYAVGTNDRTARVSGVPVERVVILAYVFSGVCAAIASLLYSSRLQAGRPVLGGLPLILDIVGANIIGGMSLTGGKGKITWTILGVLFFVVLSNTLSQMNLDSFTVEVVKGGVILMAAFFDVQRRRIRRESGAT